MPKAFFCNTRRGAEAVKAETEAVKQAVAMMNFMVISTSEIYGGCGKDTVFSKEKTDTCEVFCVAADDCL
jgi:dTDP-D-glucose 4,6-dehydratase